MSTTTKWLAGTAAGIVGMLCGLSMVGISTKATTSVAVNACHTALGDMPNPRSTIADLAGSQAADMASADPRLAAAIGDAAADAVDTLNRIDNWRDLDRHATAAWVIAPDLPLPPGAVTAIPADAPLPRQDYGYRCQAALQNLTADQRANMSHPPLLNTTPTEASTRVLATVLNELDRSEQPQTSDSNLTSTLARLLDAAPTPKQLLWTGSTVSPAAVTGGDVVFFDYTSRGPMHIAVALDNTSVATATNLDGTSPGTGHLRRQPLPTANTVIVRPNYSDNAKDPR